MRRRRLALSSAVAVASVAALALFVIPRVFGPDRPHADSWAAPAVAVPARFVPYAQGEILHSTEVTDLPGGGRQLAKLVPGTEVEIGGVTSSRRLLVARSSLWIRWRGGGASYYGFVSARSVSVRSGDVPRLEPASLARGTSMGAIEIAWLPDTVMAWGDLITESAARYGVDPEFLAIVVLVESGGNPRAGSRAGALGLTQVMPATARHIAAERGVTAFDADQLYDPAIAIDFGAYYLAQQLRSFGRRDDPDWQHSVRLAAAAYNGGPGNVSRATWPRETQAYVKWVSGMWAERRQPTSETYEAWLAAGGHRLVQSALQQLAMK